MTGHHGIYGYVIINTPLGQLHPFTIAMIQEQNFPFCRHESGRATCTGKPSVSAGALNPAFEFAGSGFSADQAKWSVMCESTVFLLKIQHKINKGLNRLK
jgi:hypothetical protein